MIKKFLIWLLTKIDPTIFENKQSIENNKDTNPIVPEEEKKEEIPEQTKEDFWNSKWERKPITYYGRILKKDTNKILQLPILQCPVDVKAFIFDNDEIMKQIILQNNLDKYIDGKSRYGNKSGLDCDATMWEIQKLICSPMNKVKIVDGKLESYQGKFIDYIGDIEENETYEFWQFPFETIRSGRGDCEDGAILMASLAINAGIPSFRVKVAAGDVDDNLGNFGGHAYCIYLASDDEWRIIDWCWYEDPEISILKKPLARKGGQYNSYKNTWFTFNNQYSWNQTELDILVSKIESICDKKDLSKKLGD
jgi:hypothetical protein